MAQRTPTDDEKEDILLSARYGELEDVQQFLDLFGPEALAGIRDENGNTVLHMVCGNGHTGETQSYFALTLLLSNPLLSFHLPPGFHWAYLYPSFPFLQSSFITTPVGMNYSSSSITTPLFLCIPTHEDWA